MEAESHYRACVDDSNTRHRNLLDVKSQVITIHCRDCPDTALLSAGAAADQGAVDAG